MTQQDPKPKLSIQDFAAKIKSKYPQYKDIDDTELTNRIISKYPQYKDQVDIPSAQTTAEPLPEGFAGPGADKAQQMEQIKKEGRKKEEAEVEALAESAGFRQITDDIIQGWAEDAAKKIATGEVDATAWSSGVEQFKSSLSAALDQASISADPETGYAMASPGAFYMMRRSDEFQGEMDELRKAQKQIKRLQKEGYFKEGGMMEGAMKRQLLANEQFKQALKDKGLDPEATMEQAFQQGGISDAMDYIRMRVTQQGAQLTGAVAAGAVGGPVMAGGLMGASSAGGDLIGKALENKKLSDEDRTAALAKGILEGTAESILSPVSKVGGTVTKRLFSGAAKEVAKQGGKAGLKQSLKKVLSASLKEGVEEAFVESMSPFIDEGVKQLYQEDADFDLDKFLTDNFGEKGRAQILESFVIGAATGSAAGGVDAATSTLGRRGEEAPAPEAEEVSISKDKEVDFHTKNLFIENKPVEDVEQEVSNYLESLTEEQRSSLEGKEEALELAVEAYNERLKDEQASQEAPVEAEGETQAEAEQEAPPAETTEEGGGEEGEGVGQRPTQAGGGRALTAEEKSQIESEYNVTLNDNIDGTYEIEPNDDTASIEDAKARVNEVTSPEQETTPAQQEEQDSNIIEEQPTTQENVQQEEEQQSEQPTQQADVQEREDERMLEGVRDDRNEEQGGQEGSELRAEEANLENVAKKAGIKPKNIKDLYRVNRQLFGLGRLKSVASAVTMDRMIGNMAKRAGISKDEMYGRLEFKKADEAPKGALKQERYMSAQGIFESNAKRGFNAINQNAATAQQWVKMIADKGGKGTAQELEWIGLEEYLVQWQKENNAKSIPDEVVDRYIEDNQINVIEVTKEGEDETKYQGYTQLRYNRKDERYREFLLTLPNKDTFSNRYNIKKDSDGNYYLETKSGEVVRKTNIKNRQVAENKFRNEFGKDTDQFKSSHWDEKNILAHLRVTDRTLPNGERVMFIEEIQSDWAQEGKKKGFGPRKVSGDPNLVEDVEQRGMKVWKWDIEKSPTVYYIPEDSISEVEYYEGEGKKIKTFESPEAALDFAKGLDLPLDGVPDMPYKNTDQWVGLAIRRALKLAADEGFNRIAWVTGEQSADRYKLSNRVNSINVEDISSFMGSSTPSRAVGIDLDRGEAILYVDKNGKVVDNDGVVIPETVGKNLSDVVGQEMSEKIMAASDGDVLAGGDLEVGGTGMKTFYNSILPKVAKKEARRFDKKAKVEIIDFRGETERRNAEMLGDESVPRELDMLDRQLSIAITPEMRMNLNSAVPLFQGDQGAMLAEDGNYIIYALTDPNVSTPLHELAHVYEHYLTDQERKDVLAWAGSDTWTVDVSEKFARGFERFLADGKAPDSKLQKIFNNFKKWLTDIYNGIKGSDIDIELNEKMRSIYSQMLKDSSIKEPRKVQTITYRTTDAKSYVVDPTDEKSINEIADKVDPEGKTDLRQVPKLAAAFRQYTNGASVVVHEDKAAAQAYLDNKYGKGKVDVGNAAGFHDRTDNTVHLVGKVPTVTRVAKHEFLHPFIEAIIVNNPDLAIDLYNKMATLPEFAPVRKWAEANYDKDTAIIEAMVDFFARVANGDIQIKPTTKDKIIQYINELLEAVGLDVSINAADVDIKQFAASLAESMRTGREIVNPFQGKPNAEGLNKMVANNNANLFPTYSNIEAVYNNMPPKRREQLAPVMEAAKLAQEILDGNKGDLRAKVAAIQTQPIESLQYLERINRYLYMKGGHNTKEQAKAFMSATAEYMTDPVRSGTINFMRVDTSDPNQRSLKSFIERKDNNPDVNDEDIVKAVMIAYDLEQDDALEAFESILQRRYVPPATSFERTGARIHNAVARRVLNFITFGVKSNGELVTARDFVDHVRVNWLSDRYAPLRTARQRIEKAYDMKLPEDFDAAAVMDTAQAKAVEYEKGILKGFRGVGDKVGGSKHLKNSFFGRIKREGIKYQDVETFLFMQHLPEFLARKNDLIARKRQDKQAELDKLRDELSKATTKKEQQRLNAKINQIETTLASDSYTQKDALGTIERNGENVPLTAELATEIKNELEAKHPKLNQMSNDYRQELLNEYYNTLREFRMIPDERIDHLVNGTSDQSDVKWDYYVPMNVIDDVARDPNEIGFNSVGAMSAEGLNKLTAGGFEYGFRDRKDPLKQLVTNVIAVREQAEVNEGYRALARLLKQYGSDNWNIVKSRITAKENSKGEIVITEITPSVKDNNSIAFINEDGKKSYIVAKNVTAQQSPMFEAMQRGDTAPGWAARWINKMINPFSNYLRRMITSLNVTFGLAQIAPDFFDALVTTSVEMQKTAQGRVAAGVKYANNYRKAITYFMTGGMTDTSDAAVAWKEAQLHGMPMSWSNLNANTKAPYEYLEDQLQKLERAEDATGLKKAMTEAGRALDRTANLLSDMNDAMENVARLAAYMTAKSYGLTPTQAAAFGKDVTVNFEAKGRKDSVVRTLYLFYGAAVKGIARTTRTAKLLGIKGSLAMITGAALVRAYQYAMMDDDEMDQLVQNDFNRQGRIVLPVPGTDVNLNFKSPYSILRIYNSIGQGIVDIAYDKRTTYDAFEDVLSNSLVVFDPIAGSSSLTSLAPTMVQPLVGTWANMNYRGEAIVHDMVLSNANRRADAFTKNTNPVFIAAADQMYNFGADIAPGHLEYLFNGYIALPAIKNMAMSTDEIFKAVGGKRASEEIAKEMGLTLPKEMIQDKVDYKRLFPISKAFYRPTEEEKISMWNLYSFNDRSQIKGFTREQFDYVINAYEICREYRHDKRVLNAIMNNIKDKFPEYDWEEYERIKERYDIINKPYEDRAKIEEEINKRGTR